MLESTGGPRQFLQIAFHEGDWTALLAKARATREWTQRVGSIHWACSAMAHDWLRECEARGRDVYASVNAIAAGARSRTRRDIFAVRHLFLDVDHDAHGVLRNLECRSDLPPPSYVLHTSSSRAHILWRTRDFEPAGVEQLQKQLAAHLGGDPAATSVTQMTRLPGFWNHKHREPYLVRVEYRDVDRIYTPHDFPSVERVGPTRQPAVAPTAVLGRKRPLERAVAYLAKVPPAIAGEHGDLHTFRTCCRLVRGFALDDDQALAVLAAWNARCVPPWSERELREKIRSARRNGREPIGGLL